MAGEDAKAPKLTSILCRNIALAASVAITAQVIVTILDNVGNEDYFARNYIEAEADNILSNTTLKGPDVAVDLSRMRHYGNDRAHDYSFRIVDGQGRVLAGSNQQLLDQTSPLQPGRQPLQQWLQRLDGGSFHFAGGTSRSIGGRPVWIEVTTLGDPSYLRMQALLSELLSDVVVPMVPLTLLTIAFAVLSVHRSLRPLTAAARKAEGITAAREGEHFDLRGLPHEAASFAAAINRLIDRIAELAEAQRQLISRAAHELRTPLAVMMLELGNISETRARQLERDVADMSEIVNRLLTLARLDSTAIDISKPIDLVTLARETIERLQSFASARGASVQLSVDQPSPFDGDPASIREAIRNLIENAIKHSPAGATVQIGCGPGSSIIVEDDGPGISEFEAKELFKPFNKGKRAYDGEGAGLGLTIVQHAVALHKGSIEVGRSALGGARFSLRFG